MIVGCGRATSPDAIPRDAWLIPYQNDETSLIEVKANPERYVGKRFIMCGAIEVSDYYSLSYSDAQDTHYSIRFTDAGKHNKSRLGDEFAQLYLRKRRGAGVADTLIKATKENVIRLARVTVTLRPDVYAEYKKWDFMEVIDVQLVTDDKKGWQAGLVK
jgi:hypothetical protein